MTTTNTDHNSVQTLTNDIINREVSKDVHISSRVNSKRGFASSVVISIGYGARKITRQVRTRAEGWEDRLVEKVRELNQAGVDANVAQARYQEQQQIREQKIDEVADLLGIQPYLVPHKLKEYGIYGDKFENASAVDIADVIRKINNFIENQVAYL